MYALICSGLIMNTNCKNDECNIVPDDEDSFVNPDVAVIYVGTQSPGDVWTWHLDKEQGHMTATWDYGTFDNTDDDIYIEGTFVTLPSGFLKVTITKSIPVSAEIPTDGTAWFYAVEIPDMALIIKPEGSIKGDIISMVPEGDCSSIPGAYNYIVTAPAQRSAYNPITQEAFGYIDFEAIGSNFKISGSKFSLDCVNGGPCTEFGDIEGMPEATCLENGKVIVKEGGNTQARGQFTNAGAMMMDFGYGNGGIYALKAKASATKEIMNNQTYIGFAYLPKNTNDPTMPVKLSFFKNELDNMIGTGHPFSSLENDIVQNDEGVVVLVNNVINGRVLGTVNFDNDVDASEMAAALLVNGNDQILIVSSYDEESLEPFILVLVNKK